MLNARMRASVYLATIVVIAISVVVLQKPQEPVSEDGLTQVLTGSSAANATKGKQAKKNVASTVHSQRMRLAGGRKEKATQGHTICVRILDASTSQPVADARVACGPRYFRQHLTPESRGALNRGLLSVDKALAQCGSVYLSDRQGFVYLDHLADRQLLIATAHDLFGVLEVDGHAGPIGDYWILHLHDDVSLVVSVADAAGRPAGGLPLELRAEFEMPGSRKRRTQRWQIGLTDEETGECRVRHLQCLARKGKLHDCRLATRLTCHVKLPGLYGISAGVKDLSQRRQRVRLVIPPVGSVRIVAIRNSGSPFGLTSCRIGDVSSGQGERTVKLNSAGMSEVFPVALGQYYACNFSAWGIEQQHIFQGPRRSGATQAVYLRPPQTAQLRVVVRVTGNLSRTSKTAHVRLFSAERKDYFASAYANESYSVDFAHVPIKTPITVNVAVGGRAAQSRCRPIGRAGARETVVVDMPQPLCVLTGRVVGEDQPVSGSLNVRMVFDDDAEKAWDVIVGRQGMFRLPGGEAILGKSLRRIALIHHDTVTGDPVAVHTRRTMSIAAGENDLGVFLLKQSPVVVTGKVIGEKGALKNLRSIQLYVEGKGIMTSGEPVWRRQDVKFSWTEDGLFTGRGLVTERELRLRMTSTMFFFRDKIRFEHGQEGLVIRFERGGAVDARVLAPASLAGYWITKLRVEMQMTSGWTAGEATGARRGQFVPLDQVRRRGWIFRWRGLKPGVYRLTVRGMGLKELAVINDIRVLGGHQVGDPRLDPVDLRNILKSVTVKVLDIENRLLSRTSSAFVLVERPGLQGPTQGYRCLQDGTVTILTATIPVTLSVHARNYAPKYLHDVFEDVSVNMSSLPLIEIHVVGLRAVKQSGARLYLRPKRAVVREAFGGFDDRVLLGGDILKYNAAVGLPVSWNVSANGRVHARVPAEGSYTVQLETSSRPNQRDVDVLLTSPANIRIKGGAARTHFQLRVVGQRK